jgi:hypothetical protein
VTVAVVLYASLLGLVVGGTLAACRRYPELRGLVPWLVTALGAALVVVALLNRPFGSGTDELTYQRQAKSVWASLLLTGRVNGDLVALDEGKWGWPTVLGIVYRAVGDDNPYVGIAINLALAYIALILTAAAGCRIWGPRQWDWWMGAFFALSPAVLVFSPSLLRETWVWLSVALAIHGLISLLGGRRRQGVVLLLVACLLVYWIRTPMSVIILGAAVGAVIVAWIWRRWGELAAVLSLAGMIVVGQSLVGYALRYIGLTPDALFLNRDYLAQTSTTGFPPSDPLTLSGLAQSMVRVGLGPLPWELRLAPVWGWVFVNWVFWVVVVIAAVVAVRRSGLTPVRLALAVFAGVVLVGLALSLTNYGIVVRMRAIVVFAVLPLVWGLLSPTVDEHGVTADEGLATS